MVYTTEKKLLSSDIIVGIPAYNEAKNIRDVIRKAKSYCDKIVVCDDGSVDDTAEVAFSEGATVLQHKKNLGYGSAIKTLFDYVKNEKYSIFVTLDSDGQHDADDIPKIAGSIFQGEADVVIGSRFLKKNDNKIPRYREFGIKTITKFTKAASFNHISDSQSGFRAYSRHAISKLKIHEEGMAVSTEILLKAKDASLSIVEVPIQVRYDVDEASTHNPITHGLSVLSSVFRYVSVKHPLTFYSLPGFGLVLVSIFFVGWSLDIFSVTGKFMTNLILYSVGFAVIGIVLIVTGTILYTMAILIQGKLDDS